VEGANVLGEYVYNGNGQRVKKYTNNGAQCTVYHYDQNGMLIAESSSSGTIKAEYIYLNGQPLAKIENNNVYYYHNDHLGTSILMTDENQNIVWEGEFKPFGEALTVNGSVTNNLRFPGQYFDDETELHYNYYRDYNPVVGRYVEADPVGINGDVNIFNYVNGNPIMKIDILGLKTIDGMNCNEISRMRVPGFSQGNPRSYNAGFVWICMGIVIEDSASCVCTYEKNKHIIEFYNRFVSFEVTYKCVEKDECNKEIIKTIKKYEIDEMEPMRKDRYIPLGILRFRHGTTTAAFGGCSECLQGVGQVRYGL
jgi:RHS repeat-associated protein